MANCTYNGWTNRATWLVNIWFNPESKADVEFIRENIEVEYENLSGFFKDMVDLNAIDWDELESHFDDEDEEESDDDDNHVSYDINKASVLLIMSGDCGDMTDDEIKQTGALLAENHQRFGDGYWIVHDEDENFTKCEVTGLFSDCSVLRYMIKG